MQKKYVTFIFVVLSLFSTLVCSEVDFNASTWVYDKVSNVDVFGKHDSNVIAHIDESFKKVIITTKDKKLTIKNDFLENNNVCSTDFVSLKKTPLSYYLSQKTADMYKKVYDESNVPLSDDIDLLMSLYPGKECPAPYAEILRVNDYLTVSDQNYILFFKHVNEDEVRGSSKVRKMDLSSYCRDEDPNKEFDGETNTECTFPGMGLSAAYNKLKELSSTGEYLNPKLPTTNEKDKVDSGNVDYQWQGKGKLKISLEMDNESIHYIFNEESTGTNLLISTESQY